MILAPFSPVVTQRLVIKLSHSYLSYWTFKANHIGWKIKKWSLEQLGNLLLLLYECLSQFLTYRLNIYNNYQWTLSYFLCVSLENPTISMDCFSLRNSYASSTPSRTKQPVYRTQWKDTTPVFKSDIGMQSTLCVEKTVWIKLSHVSCSHIFINAKLTSLTQHTDCTKI